MSNITKISLVFNVEGQDKPLIAALGFQGLEPAFSDVDRLYRHLTEQVAKLDGEPALDLKLNVTNEATKKEVDKA